MFWAKFLKKISVLQILSLKKQKVRKKFANISGTLKNNSAKPLVFYQNYEESYTITS